MLAPSGQGRVPVIIDGPEDDPKSWVSDSWKIALYLEGAYPERPALFPAGIEAMVFLRHWVERQLFPVIAPPVMLPLQDLLSADDQAFFRKIREPRFGCTLEEFAQRDGETLDRFNQVLEPLRATLRDQPFLGGEGRTMPTTTPLAHSNGRAVLRRMICCKRMTRFMIGVRGSLAYLMGTPPARPAGWRHS